MTTLLLAGPDHADRLIRDCLPALREILEDVNRPSEVHARALRLLAEITATAAYSGAIIQSGLVECVVQWLRYAPL